MEDTSIFPDKTPEPTDADLAEKLGNTYELWKQIQDMVLRKYPGASAEWTYSGKKYGWSFRIKDKKRAIIYLLPRGGYFKTAFVFGQKATDEVLGSDIASHIKDDLKQARQYAEGRGIRIDIKDSTLMTDIEQLVEIKLRN